MIKKVRSALPSLPWIIILLLVVLFFSGSMIAANRSIVLVHDNNLSVSNTLQVMSRIQSLRMAVISAETGKRGYLLTADGQYLSPYHEAMADIDRLMVEIANSNTEIEAQRDRFQLLETLVDEKIDRMQELVQMVHLGRRKEAIESLEDDVGIDLMRRIESLFDEMESDERLLLDKNRQNAQQDRHFIQRVLMSTNGLGLALSLFIFLAAYRHSRKERILYEKIEQANDELEDKVAERTHTLQQYSDELQRSNRELEEFAFIASHDLQEPLRKIRAFGDRLKAKYAVNLDERGADYIDRMHAASERMSLLIDDLLSFSRVTTRQEPFVEVDLNSVVSDALEDLEYAIEDANCIIKRDRLPSMMGDASQLRQVFMNLVSNSIKFRKADVRPEVSIYCKEYEKASEMGGELEPWCTLCVKDNGIGFDDQYADKVFNLFQRLHGREEYAGTGIGLALCRKIIERHGGSVIAVSEPGAGTEFFIDFPLQYENLPSL